MLRSGIEKNVSSSSSTATMIDAVSSSISISITTRVNSILDRLKCPKHWGAKEWGQSVSSGKSHMSHKTRKMHVGTSKRKIGSQFQNC